MSIVIFPLRATQRSFRAGCLVAFRSCFSTNSMAELVLDINIRGWVFLPIVLITFLVGIIRHYVSLLITSQKKVELTQVQDSQVLIRSRMLRENGRYISKQGFYMRRHYFNNEENGYFKTQKRAAPAQTAMPDPSMMTEMLKGNVTNVLPMVVIGGWINWMFSGFVTTKVPFPLTLRFKPMLQRGNRFDRDNFLILFPIVLFFQVLNWFHWTQLGCHLRRGIF